MNDLIHSYWRNGCTPRETVRRLKKNDGIEIDVDTIRRKFAEFTQE